MRILFDARSIQTPAGLEVFRGLSAAWVQDPRVTEVMVACSPESIAHKANVEGTTPALIERADWVSHVTIVVPQIARRSGADVVFMPNGVPALHRRSVVYYQDLHHFRSGRVSVRIAARRLYSRYARDYALLSVCVSRDIAEACASWSRAPLRIIPNGVDVRSLRWRGGPDIVFVMGGTGARKSEETAVRAWSLIHRDFPSTRLVIGGVAPGNRIEALNREVRERGLSRCVEVIGPLPREEYLGYAIQSRACVSCSRLESFGMPVAEGLALGAPIVCSSLPAHLELLAAAAAGSAFPGGDHVALASVLRGHLDGSTKIPVAAPLVGWDWASRGQEHIDAFQSAIADCAET